MKSLIADAAVHSGHLHRLRAWWVYRLLYSPDPLGERPTLLWHNHFATSNADLGASGSLDRVLVMAFSAPVPPRRAPRRTPVRREPADEQNQDDNHWSARGHEPDEIEPG